MYVDELLRVGVSISLSRTSKYVGTYYYALTDKKFSVQGLVDKDGDWVQRNEFGPDGRVQRYSRRAQGRDHVYGDLDGDGDVDDADFAIRQANLTGPGGSGRAYGQGDLDGDGDIDPSDEALHFAASTGPGALTATSDPGLRTPTRGDGKERDAQGVVALCTIGFQGLMGDEVTGNTYQRARWYSARLGRFMQRDPLGYPDGMNSYAAYHVLEDGWDPFGLSRWERVPNWHHNVPQQFEDYLEDPDFLDSADNGYFLRAGDHNNLHCKQGWNDEWKEFFKNQPEGQKVSTEDLIKQIEKMRADPKYKSILDRGFPAKYGYDEWRKLDGPLKGRIGAKLARRFNKILGKKTVKCLGASVPFISLLFTAEAYADRADNYTHGGAVCISILDNIPIVDLAVGGAEILEQYEAELDQASSEAAKELEEEIRRLNNPDTPREEPKRPVYFDPTDGPSHYDGTPARREKRSSPGDPGYVGCFTSGTMVSTEFGMREIQSVTKGMRLWSYNFSKSRYELKEVTEIHSYITSDRLIDVSVENKSVVSTPEHPYFVLSGKDLFDRPFPGCVPGSPFKCIANASSSFVGVGRWVTAGDLQVGDKLLLRDGVSTIKSIEESQAKSVEVFNITVEDNHNYMVTEHGILVHNKI